MISAPGHGPALQFEGETFALLPEAISGCPTFAQSAHIFDTWEAGDGRVLTPEDVVNCLTAKGLLRLN